MKGPEGVLAGGSAWASAAAGFGAALAAVVAAGCAGGDGGGAAGAVPVVQLGEVEAEWGEAFAVVSTVRELPGGRVLVADPLGQVVVSLDMATGAADTIGGVGGGPAEYRQPDAVWPLPDGRTLLVDLGNGRLTVLSPELEFGDTRPYSVLDPAAGIALMAVPQGVDAMGRLYFRGMPAFGQETDSLKILRMDLEAEAADSLGVFKRQGSTREESGSAGSQNVRITPIPLSPEDAWGVAPDGRVVVARAGDYHVDWIETDGSITSGPPIPLHAGAYRAGGEGGVARQRGRDRGRDVGPGLDQQRRHEDDRHARRRHRRRRQPGRLPVARGEAGLLQPPGPRGPDGTGLGPAPPGGG